MRDLRPAALLARAIRHRTAGDLLGEEALLQRCVHRAEAQHAHARRDDVEAARVAHFYLALQQCQLGRFQEADTHLTRLGLGVRLADQLWTETCSDVPGEDFALRVFDDGLPAELVRQARDALHPAASYWHDHRYHSEDVAFYSHAHFPGDETHVIDQLIEAMRPLLAEVDPKIGSSLKVAEWWVHQRQPDQWHGHPLHYDTNEQLLRDSQGRCVEHPAISSVVYLCDDSPRFGATVVTSQEYGDAAKPGFRGEAALVRPKLGRVLFFKGSYLHGALPGRPWLEHGDPQRRLNVMVGWWTTPITTQPAADPPAPLMRSGVGTWIRDLQKARLDGVAGGARAVEEEVRGTSPIWVDCGHGEAGEGEGDSTPPPFGRFFLRRRSQVDGDIFN